MVIKVIEPEWKRAPQTMDRVRRRIGEVLGFAEVRGLRKPGPLPTRWKNHLDKLLPHPRELKPVVHHAAMTYDAVPDLYRPADRHRRDSRTVPCLHDPDGGAQPRGARRAVGRDRLQGEASGPFRRSA